MTPTLDASAIYDVAAVRAQFPALHQSVNGRPLAYLDSAASSQKPRAVIDAISSYYEHDHANVHRGVHTLSQRATAAFEDARRVVARHVGADPDEIVFTRGSTEAINLVAGAWGPTNVGAGDEIVVSHMEHHSNIVPWQLLAARVGATFRVAPIRDDGALDIDGLAALLGPRTRLVALVHVSNALGTVNPIAEVARRAHDVGAAVLIDGAQALPHLAVDVRAAGVDFYTMSAHKAYGPTGIGALYGRAEVLRAMPPWQGGGDMIRSVSFDGTTFADPPARFEAGTPNIAGAIGMAAGLAWLERTGVEAVAAHERRLAARAAAGLAEIPGVRLWGTAPDKAGVVSFTIDGAHPTDVGTLLDQQGIAVRTGHHCTEPLWKRLGVAATARASFAAYSTDDEVDRLVAGVRVARRLLTGAP